MEQLGIVDKLNGKQARSVRPRHIGELSAELVEFMAYCDYPCNSLICAFQERVANTVISPKREFFGGVQDE